MGRKLSGYAFRFKFSLSPGHRIKHDGQSIRVPLSSDDSVLLKAVDKPKTGNAEILVFVGSGYPSEVDANQKGLRLKHAVLIACASLRIGIDPGKDEALSGSGKPLRQRAKERGSNLLDDVHGLATYKDDKPVFFGVFRARVILSTPVDTFLKTVADAHRHNPKLSPKQSLALELYGLSHFESSLRARFVTLVTVVEVLCERGKIPKHIQEHLRQLTEVTRSADLGETDKKALLRGLMSLKRESISKACQSLVKRCLDDDASNQFKKFYKTRGTIVHRGKVRAGVDLGADVNALDQLVSRLLVTETLGITL